MKRKCAYFIGRWQPCHRAHEWLIREKLKKGVPCHVVIRDIEPDERNPYSSQQVLQLLKAAFLGEDVTFEIGPDCESVNVGRGVGYDVIEHGECPKKGISGTKVRAMIAEGEDIGLYVSPAVEAALRLL